MPQLSAQNTPSPQEQAAASFYSQPILNSPYQEPDRHWELDEAGQPTKRILYGRRPADFITPVSRPYGVHKRRQGELIVDATQAQADAMSTKAQEFHKAIINEIRRHVSDWRKLPKTEWKVTPVTARLLEYWRTHEFGNIRPFFC